MHTFGLLSVLALAGSIAAAPVPEPEVVYVTKVATVVVTAGAEPTAKPAAYTPAPQPYNGQRTRKPASSVYAVVSSVPKPSQPATSAAPAPAKPTTSAAPAPAPSAPASGGSDYIDIANKWRTKMGLPNFTKDAKLEANAKKTCSDGNGQMVHELNPGTMGQVLAPGKATEFEKVFVGGWLCEVSSTPGLDGVCGEFSKGWNYMGQTGHNEILTSKKYTKIGCGLEKGIWGCDVA
ncbi:hypothetical protein CC80DRAFT_495649 [Byssothecium circinans]|uniref:SCP domain-containing protein n=1 Tax=Byssothecium circinans TaxID=147558 RepID=A0A6A5TMJ6_9PLEO|nr:hypothetical protein CC80DRAFT_495649 [Byssothecium circinans]